MPILETLIRHALASGLVIAAAAAQAQLAPTWSQTAAGVNAVSSALDGSNNVLASGTTLTPAMSLTKVGANGAVLWQRTFAGVARSRATAVAVDANGNAIQVGMVLSDFGAPVGTVVLKYSAAGTLLWQEVRPASFGLAAAVTTDSTGNVYVLSRVTAAGATTDEAVLAKLSPAGVREWERLPGLRFVSDQPMTFTSTGRVVVAGSGGSGSTAGQSRLAAYDSAGNPTWGGVTNSDADVVLASGPSGELVVAGRNTIGFSVVKYDAQFKAQWQYSVPAKGATRHVAVDGWGNIVLTGPTDTSSGIALVLENDWLTAKLSAAGALVWTRTWGEAGADELPNAMALGAEGSVLVTGQGSLASTDSAGNVVRGPSTTTVKYDASGAVSWSSSVLQGAQGRAVGVGSDGAAYVVGGGPVELGATAQTVLRYLKVAANQAPVAMASVSTSAGVAPLSVDFSSAGSSDPDGSIAAYRWDFGDNTSSALANANHIYNTAGSYMAKLTVTDDQGATATSSPIAITVSDPAPATSVKPGVPKAISLPSSSMPSLSTMVATVTLSTTSGATVQLLSSSPSVASVPDSVVVPAGAKSATFTITSGSVSRKTTVTLSAAANGKLVNARLTVFKP